MNSTHANLLYQVFALIACSRVLGKILKQRNIPAVVAELLTGILFGPSFLGLFFPDQQTWLFPSSADGGLSGLAQIGSLLLLMIAGLEINLKTIHSYKIIVISICGIILPFFLGFITSPFIVPHPPHGQLLFSLFIATSMSISALSVMAKTFIDLGMIQSKIAQFALPAAMGDDVIGWILLSLITNLATNKTLNLFTLFKSLVTILIFIISILYFATKIKNFIYRLSSEKFATCIIICMMAANFALFLNIEPILGAFLAALVQPLEIKQEVKVTLNKMISSFFSPIFFGVAGLKVNFSSLASSNLIKMTVIIIVIACVGKVLGAYVGGRLLNLGHSESLAIGWAMNARGSQEIIIASLGIKLNIIPQSIYTSIIIMSVVTSLIAGPMLRKSLSESDQFGNSYHADGVTTQKY